MQVRKCLSDLTLTAFFLTEWESRGYKPKHIINFRVSTVTFQSINTLMRLSQSYGL